MFREIRSSEKITDRFESTSEFLRYRNKIQMDIFDMRISDKVIVFQKRLNEAETIEDLVELQKDMRA